MKIKDLKNEHPRIYELAMLRQKEAGNEADDELRMVESGPQTFFWSETIEGIKFWRCINEGDFDVFYQKYPHTNDLPLINPEMLETDYTEHTMNGASMLVHKDFEAELSKATLEGVREYLQENLPKDPINKAWHEKFNIKKSVPSMRNPPETPTKAEAIKPDYYKFNIKGTECDLFQIAEALNLPTRLFSALKYFRVKGDKEKKINDLEKAIECIRLQIEHLKSDAG